VGNIRVVASELVLGGYHFCKIDPRRISGQLSSSQVSAVGAQSRHPLGERNWWSNQILWTNTGKPKLSALPLNPRVLRLGLEFNVKATSFFLASKVIVN
jgi:hypothetical protein